MAENFSSENENTEIPVIDLSSEDENFTDGETLEDGDKIKQEHDVALENVFPPEMNYIIGESKQNQNLILT